jgi:hypothetical protein
VSRAALSIAIYAIYLLGQGATMLLIPGIVLPILGLPVAADFWVRVVGMTLVFFGLYYLLAARLEYRRFFILTVFTRAAVPFIFAAFVALSLAPAALLLLVPADLAFTAWTAWALWSTRSEVVPAAA